MWPKRYKDYPVDKPMVQQTVEPGKGIMGCEMHEINGWGNEIHHPKKRKPGLITRLLTSLFRKKNDHL